MRSLSREVGSFSEFRSDCRRSGQNRIFGDYFRIGGKPGAIWTITPPSLRQTSPLVPGHISGQRFETLEGLILEPSEFVPKLTLCETRRAWLWSASCRYTSSAFARP